MHTDHATSPSSGGKLLLGGDKSTRSVTSSHFTLGSTGLSSWGPLPKQLGQRNASRTRRKKNPLSAAFFGAIPRRLHLPTLDANIVVRPRLVEPHGGPIVNRLLTDEGGQRLRQDTPRGPRITISERSMCDLICIATGAFSPLSGFMGQDDYVSCIETMRLSNNVIWSIPIVLPVDASELVGLKLDQVALLLG